MSTLVDYDVSRLIGKVQNYAWGGYDFIPALIGLKPEPGTTYAEYWLGAHHKAPSEIVQGDGRTLLLDNLIERQTEAALGSYVAHTYGRLPFLLKVLDVREMLSIQVHPTKAEAEAGFARENELGIPLDSPTRNYKDDNHKPEIQLALSDFWLLHGFRPEEQLYEVLTNIPEFCTLVPIFVNSAYFGLYKYIMEMPSEAVDALLRPLAARILPRYDGGMLEKTSPDYWAAKAMRETSTEHYDRGIFSIYFFNLVKLEPGQAQFQDAGVPHALLSGQTMEIMANSDNVIRGGLTPKQIDIPQLLKLVTFKGITSEIIVGKQSNNLYEEQYASPCQEFSLNRILLKKGDCYENTTHSAEILFTLHGEVMLNMAGRELSVKKGASVIVFAHKRCRVRAVSESALLFRAFIPAVPASI
jgi:mannose-6-phosphate isomerase